MYSVTAIFEANHGLTEKGQKIFLQYQDSSLRKA
jgi:hypothetical protein